MPPTKFLFQTKAEAYLAVNGAAFHQVKMLPIIFLVASLIVIDLL